MDNTDKIDKIDWKKYEKHLQPPGHWANETRKRVETLIIEYDIEDAAGLLILQQFGNAEAREIEAREQILTDGQTVLDRFQQQKPHPLLSAERDARSQKLQALKALNLDIEPLKDRSGRPSGGEFKNGHK